MQLKQEGPLDENFTKVPNAFIRDEAWHSQSRAMSFGLILYSFGNRTFNGQRHLSNILGDKWTARKISDYLSILRRLGWVELKEGVYTIRNTKGVVKQEAADIAEATYETADELQAEPKRKPTGLSAKERRERIIKAWNKHKTDNCVTMNAIHPSLYIAIETQTKKLGVDRDDYDGFMEAVMGGIRQDDWWSKLDVIKPNAIFGWGADIEDKKFRNTEKLYKSGHKKRGFHWNDKNVLKWYHSCGKKNFTTVEWITLEGPEPTEEERELFYECAQEGATVIRIGTPKGRKDPTFWPWYGLRGFAIPPVYS